MSMAGFLEASLYFLALINPASKVLILSSAEPAYTQKQLFSISAKSTFIALAILILLAVAGYFVLKKIFHVDIYSLQVAGGTILFLIGLTAVQKGRFYEQNLHGNEDISIVPLAAPLIAGPGTITAAISFSSTHGIEMTVLSLTVAVMANFVIMLMSLWLGKILKKLHLIGPLIRITGLVVAAVAVQMVLTGLGQWIAPLLKK